MPARAWSAVSLVVALLATGCGGGGDTGAETASAIADAPTADPADSTTTTAAPATTAAAPATVEAAPAESPYERIVVGDQALLDAALALDLDVLGIPGFNDRETIPAYLADLAGEVEPIGDRNQVNLELLAAATPDLLVINEKSVEASGVRDQLEQIAPLVEVDVTTATPWREALRLVADAAEVSDRADAVIAATDTFLADARDRLGADALATEVSVVRCFGQRCRYLPGGTSFSGQVLDELGVARPARQASDPEGRAFVDVSPEQYDLLGGDVIILFGTDATDTLAELQANPLWAALPAVQAGLVFEVDPAPWFIGNVLAIRAIVDDIVEILGS
ncbi:MAG: iron-siderophore ABC transporter substrate-binding protein [Actinomycetota bacterium]